MGLPELASGTVIAGRYAVVRLLGRGATKVVYLADDKLAGAQVALALLTGEVSRDPTLAARFSREGRTASAIRSPFVVRVFDVGKLTDGTRYLATEAVLGRGLDEAMAHGAIAPALAARFTLHVLAGLGAAHDRGVLHRDVKPENVMLAPGDDGEVAKLTDFGLAKVLDGSLEGSVLLRTAQNVVLGTPEYMSPEQWRGDALDARTDVYATGVMFYEMLRGRCPFESQVLHAICLAHVTQAPPPFPLDAPAEVRAYEPIVMRALAKSPADRFESVHAMRAAVERVAGYALGAGDEVTEPVLTGRALRAELVCDAWPGAVCLIATTTVLLGRDERAHVVARCLPDTPENAQRSLTVARLHARLEWRGGGAVLTALEDASSGTFAAERSLAPHERAELRNGDELRLGPHVRYLFEHAPSAPGELPRWARLVRVDAFGSGQVTVLVLTEAKVSSATDAAVWVPAGKAAGDVLRVRAERAGLVVFSIGAPEPVALRDGQVLSLGGLKISVAVEGAGADAG